MLDKITTNQSNSETTTHYRSDEQNFSKPFETI